MKIIIIDDSDKPKPDPDRWLNGKLMSKRASLIVQWILFLGVLAGAIIFGVYCLNYDYGYVPR